MTAKTITTKKATTKKAAPQPAKAPTRKELLAALDKHKYEGPRSFTATTLGVVVAWLDAKAPATKADGIPTGVLYAVHPELKPVKAAAVRKPSKTYVAGYDAAMVAVREHLASAKTVGDVAKFIDAHLTQDA